MDRRRFITAWRAFNWIVTSAMQWFYSVNLMFTINVLVPVDGLSSNRSNTSSSNCGVRTDLFLPVLYILDCNDPVSLRRWLMLTKVLRFGSLLFGYLSWYILQASAELPPAVPNTRCISASSSQVYSLLRFMINHSKKTKKTKN